MYLIKQQMNKDITGSNWVITYSKHEVYNVNLDAIFCTKRPLFFFWKGNIVKEKQSVNGHLT